MQHGWYVAMESHTGLSTSTSTSQATTSTCLEHDLLSTDEESTSNSAESLLSWLKSPRMSDLARKRKIAMNPPPKGKRTCQGATAAESKNVSVYQRVKAFPAQPLCVSNKKLFCKACREELSLKMSSLRNHIRCAKHKEGVKRLKSKELREKSIAEALAAHNEQNHLKGETLPADQQVYRVKVVSCFMRKYDHFCELLEENALRLSDRRHMSDLIHLFSQRNNE